MNNKKLFLLGGIGLFSIAMVIGAVFLLQTFSFDFVVQEPLSIEYTWQEYPYECGSQIANDTYSAFIGSANPGRIIYPGNNERICFRINSLSNGLIPLFVNYTAGESISDFTLNFPVNIEPGENEGFIDLTIAPDAEGIATGTIQFGRGN